MLVNIQKTEAEHVHPCSSPSFYCECPDHRTTTASMQVTIIVEQNAEGTQFGYNNVAGVF
jgi:hypothetical protein